jgi:hypothetical protein
MVLLKDSAKWYSGKNCLMVGWLLNVCRFPLPAIGTGDWQLAQSLRRVGAIGKVVTVAQQRITVNRTNIKRCESASAPYDTRTAHKYL